VRLDLISGDLITRADLSSQPYGVLSRNLSVVINRPEFGPVAAASAASGQTWVDG